MSNATLSVYASPWHRYPQYLDYVQRLQPAWIRIHQPQAGDISQFQRVSPNSKIMLRQWDFDDSNGDRKRELYADPKAAARKLLEHWGDKAAELERKLREQGLPYDKSKWYFGAWNEPDPAYIPQIVEGTLEAMRFAELFGMRLGVVCASVGNFGKPDEPAPNWNNFKPLEKPINDGGHILIVHEYWQQEGPAGVWVDAEGNQRSDAGNLAWRHHSIPIDVPILIGEAGANGYIFGRMSGEDDCGWQRMMNADTYAAQVRQYIDGCDNRVQGVCLYMTDYHSDQWASFDTLPAHDQLVAVSGATPQTPSPFTKQITVHLPIVNNGAVGHEDLFERSMTFLRKWEGGFQNNPEDHGNWTGGRKGVGELKGTKFGISAASYPDLDIVNLTQEQADAIYRRDYWQRSGADKLQWPACLLIFDTAVLHGVGTALNWQKEVGTDAFVLAAKRLRRYTQLDNWSVFGAGWTNRVAALLEEIGKHSA